MAKEITTWSQLIGNSTQKYFLLNAIQRNVLPHFILFTGGYGTGKSTVANLLSKTILCKNRNSSTGEPCGECTDCVQMDKRVSDAYVKVNVPELSGKEDIKSAINAIFRFEKLSEKTIFILEEIHGRDKSTLEIQKALLDVLSNIPDDVYVISCTTRAYEMLPELLNRAYTVELDTPTTKECEEFIGILCGEYGIYIESNEVITNLAEACGNSLRQISEVIRVVATDNKLTNEYLTKMFKFSKDENVLEFIDAFVNETELYKYISRITKHMEENSIRSTLKRSIDFIFEFIVQNCTGTKKSNYSKFIGDKMPDILKGKSEKDISVLMSILGKISLSDKESDSKKLSKLIDARLEFSSLTESKKSTKSQIEQKSNSKPDGIIVENRVDEVKSVPVTAEFGGSIQSSAELQRILTQGDPTLR